MVFFSLATAGLSISIAKHYRRVAFEKTCHRLEKMCFQAFRYSAVNTHVANVVIQKYHETWEAYLGLWGDNDTVRRVTQRCSFLKDLRCVSSIRLGDQKVSQLVLQFFGSEGLTRITGLDESGRPLKNIDFLRIVDGKESTLPPILIEPEFRGVDAKVLDIMPYISPVTLYPAFPNEYTHCD